MGLSSTVELMRMYLLRLSMLLLMTALASPIQILSYTVKSTILLTDQDTMAATSRTCWLLLVAGCSLLMFDAVVKKGEIDKVGH